MIGKIVAYEDGNMLGNRLVEHMETVAVADDKARNHIRYLILLRTETGRYGVLDIEESVKMVWWYPKAKNPDEVVAAYSKDMEKMRQEIELDKP